MTEANHNTNSSNFDFSFEFQENREQQKEEVTATANQLSREDRNSPENNDSVFPVSCEQDISETEPKMNWQKVAHKLREYNRKLLKKVFRLEQELADIDNKFNKYIEKSRSSDVLVAQQEAEIRKYQEKIELCDREFATFQAKIDRNEETIANVSEEYKTSQQQTAQLERECTLLQEKYNDRTYELISKEKEIKELQNKLSQQQRSALQYKAELQRYQQQPTIPEPVSSKEPTIPSKQKYSPQRSIKPWSTSTSSETTISLPKTKIKSMATVQKANPSETIKTAAQIATWSASQVSKQQTPKTDKTTAQSKSSVKVKPKSLAAVDLPTFPRPM